MVAQVQKGIDELPGPRRHLARWSVRTGRRAAERTENGGHTGGVLALRERIADRLVLHRLRALLGFDEAHILVTGAAPISPEVIRFLRGIGLEILEEYG